MNMTLEPQIQNVENAEYLVALSAKLKGLNTEKTISFGDTSEVLDRVLHLCVYQQQQIEALTRTLDHMVSIGYYSPRRKEALQGLMALTPATGVFPSVAVDPIG